MPSIHHRNQVFSIKRITVFSFGRDFTVRECRSTLLRFTIYNNVHRNTRHYGNKFMLARGWHRRVQASAVSSPLANTGVPRFAWDDKTFLDRNSRLAAATEAQSPLSH